MNKKNIILNNFKKYIRFNTPLLIVLVILTLLLAFNQGISFLLLIPLLQLLDIKSNPKENEILDFFNAFIQKLDIKLSLETMLLFYVIVLTTLYILQNRKSILQSKYQNLFSSYIRIDLYKKVIFSDWKILNQISKHSHIQVLTSEIPRVTTFYYYLLNVSTNIIILTVYLLLACFVSLKISILLIFIGLLQFFILSKFFKKSYAIGDENRKTFKTILKYLDDFWITIKPAKIHNTESFYYNNFAKANDLYTDYQIKQVTNNEKPNFLYKILGLINLVLLVYIADRYFNYSISTLIVLILLFNRILPLFMKIFNDINQMYLNANSLISIENMRFDINKASETNNIEIKNIIENKITLKNITFSYSSERLIFDNLNLEIKAKKITGIVGPSGKGKTTLIDLICGLLEPEHGEILFDSIVQNKKNSASIRKHIGYLPQESLFVDGTIRENLIWDTNITPDDNDIYKVLDQVNALDILKQKNLTLDSDITNFKFSFSGGELQRLALARVLIRKPQLLILDEATSALDENNENLIMSLIENFKNDTTIIFITHKKGIQKYFDDIIYL